MSEHNTPWCHHTFSPWSGGHRPHSAFHMPSSSLAQKTSNWDMPHLWNNLARSKKERVRVSCFGSCDVFDEHKSVDPKWRADLWAMIEHTPHLDWLLLTSKPRNVCKMVPTSWLEQGFPPHVWMGATAENQKAAERNVPALAALPARVRFLSCEPLLGPLELRNVSGLNALSHVHWVVAGGENPPHMPRPNVNWLRKLRDDCFDYKSKFFFKYWTSSPSSSIPPVLDGCVHHTCPH